MRFLSDNTASACPEILAAMAAANHGRVPAYGEDEWSSRLDRACGDFFGTEVRAFLVSTGTAANALSLATLSPPYGAVFAHEDAHIATDECGAPGFFTGGAQLVLLPGEHGRLAPERFRTALAAHGARQRTATTQIAIRDHTRIRSRLLTISKQSYLGLLMSAIR